jgi:hypothetical protein
MDNDNNTPLSDDAAFEAGFATAHDADDYESPAESSPQDDSESQPQEQEGAESEAQSKEPAVLAGLTETEIKNLFQRVAKVDDLEAQLRKAHGKLGEFNASLQELRKSPPAESFSFSPESTDDPDLKQYMEDFPEFAKLAQHIAGQMAQKIVGERFQEAQTQQNEQQMQYEMAMMEQTHPGWTSVVQSQDFEVWLAAQPDALRETFATAATARELSPILGSFKNTQQQRTTKTARNNDRLFRAVTPTGTSQVSSNGLSDDDAFEAGFKSVRQAYR